MEDLEKYYWIYQEEEQQMTDDAEQDETDESQELDEDADDAECCESCGKVFADDDERFETDDGIVCDDCL